MKIVMGTGINYNIVGEREEEAAAQLEEALTAVSKRRNAYVQSELDDILASLKETFGVEITTSL